MKTPATATRAVRTGLGRDAEHGAVVAPIHLSSNFTFAGYGDKRRYDYTRSGNPTRDALGEALAGLEGGAGSVVTCSGMAAITLICQLLEPHDLLLAPHDCYGGTHRLLSSLAARGQFRVTFVNQSDDSSLAEAFAAQPRMILVETPSNPLLRITDLDAVGRLCAESGTLFVADNTFLSPGWQRPMAHGADIVLHSTTKYLNGHSDVVGGAVVARTRELHERLDWWANCLGLTGAPFDSFMTLRGIRTLHARLRSHGENAGVLAELLCGHAAVSRVHYPGLPGHPGHDVARRQQSGFGGMLSFELAGGEPAVRAFLDGLELFFLAESLGGVESLVAHPASMTHAAMDPEARCVAGISDALLRLSVGIEDAADLAADLEAALERALGATERPLAAVAAG
ncbi:cystathionine gamma-synthase [Wenzhouxiangella sp. XN24]|uniref:cystathionine gamma-synthase n=1 Tax=Wenzhouxiangella sp. XN24 TaxID=2713569 RepID=UPI0013ED24D8|nr:cystathionine gamma-synthase [Wenzhouxiangella sp. XN24]NGX15617.1 cystathionine gamma-synthase [Wenzhouxiangella sp. XN24]